MLFNSLILSIMDDVISAIGNAFLSLLTMFWNALKFLFKDIIFAFFNWLTNFTINIMQQHPWLIAIIIISVVLMFLFLWNSIKRGR